MDESGNVMDVCGLQILKIKVESQIKSRIKRLSPKYKEAGVMKWLCVLRLCSILPGVALGTTIPTPSPEPRDDPPSCFSSSETSQSHVTEVRIPLRHLWEPEKQ